MSPRSRVAADAWGALLRVHAEVVPKLDDAVRQATGLPLSQCDVLLELTYAPKNRLRMADLGERAVLSRTRVSRVVDELVDRGLVRKEEHPDDRRSSYAVLTAEGRKEFRKAAPVYLNAIEERFAQLRDQLRLVADRRRQSRIDCTGIISHVVNLQGSA